MDLTRNRKAEFTKWVVSTGLLTEPFVLIDVGVQGGENKRWRPLGDCLVVHGFDPIEEVVQQLVEENRGRSNRQYHCMALGNADGEQAFYFNPANPTASSMYQQSTGRFGVDTSEQRRTVSLRRLDSLLAEGVIPIADYIKIDVEGFEAEVLAGLSRPVAALSFEFTTIQRAVAAAAIDRCAALGYVSFNAALGESQTLVHEPWLTASQIAQWLAALPDAANSGDVYALLS